MKHCSPVCHKILGVLRILLGFGMLGAGLFKLNASAQDYETIGSAAHMVGLTFLAAPTWFWIALVVELIAGLFLVSGCCKLTKVGAGLTVIIMLFALNFMGRFPVSVTWIPWVYLIVAVVILIYGGGAWCFCQCPGCKTGISDKKTTGCCDGGTCCSEKKTSSIGQMKEGAAIVGAGAVAGATEMVQKAKDIAGQAKGVAQNVVEKADNLVEKAQELVEKYDEVIEKVGGEAGKKVVATAKTVLDKADSALDSAQKVVGDK